MEKFKNFIRQSLSEKFKAFFPGMCFGFLGSQHILFSGMALSLVMYAIKFTGSIIMAFGSGLATSYAALLIDKYQNKKNGKAEQKKRKDDRAA